jgi:uncharacterized membrane protein
MAETPDRSAAQRRVERIHAFQQQLEELIRDGVLSLSGEQRERLDSHLNKALAELAERFDVDVSESQKQISLGMRILSALGGLALCAALILFFYRFWGMMATPLQVGVLVGAPVLAVVAMELVARREKTLYFAGLIGLIVMGSFILNLTVLGSLFNVVPSPNAFLAWGLLALILAYTYRLRIPLLIGLVSLLIYVAASFTALSGAYSLDFLQRPENFLPGGLLLVAVPLVVRHRKQAGFPAVYRMVGLSCFFIALEFLVHAGDLSYLPFARGAIETAYRILGFAAAGATIWLGIRHNLVPIVNLGSLFFAIYIFDRLISSWWDWMPKYLFFLIIGVTAIVLLALFRKLRLSTRRISA